MIWESPKIEDSIIQTVVDMDSIIIIKSISREEGDGHKFQSDVKGGRSFTINKDYCGHFIMKLPDYGQKFRWTTKFVNDFPE